MKQTRFKKAGWTYLPVHATGVLITLGVIVCIASVGMVVFKNSRYVREGFYETFVFPGCTAFCWK